MSDPLSTKPVLTAQIEDRAARLDKLTNPDFYDQNIESMVDNPSPFADNISLREAQMWANFSQPATPQEVKNLKSFGPDADEFAFVDDAADTDYLLSLSTRGHSAMDRHLEDAIHGEEKMSRKPGKGPLEKSGVMKKLAKVYKHLALKSALNNGRKAPDASDKSAAKRVIADYSSRLTGIGQGGLPTEILGADYGVSIGNMTAAQKARYDKMTPAQKKRFDALAARQAQAKAKKAAAQQAAAKKKIERLATLKAKQEEAKKRRLAAAQRAEAAKKRKIARSKPRPGTPSSSPMTVTPGRVATSRQPTVTISQSISRPNPSPLIVTREAEPAPEADPENVSIPAEESPVDSTPLAPDMPATESEAETAEADADATEAQAEATEAEADADEAESTEEEVTPDDLSGDFIGAVPAEQTKVVRKAAEKSPTGAKLRAGMSVYRKVKAGDPKAKAAVVKMATRASNGDGQAKSDLLSVKLGKVAQKQLEKAKRAYAVVKKAAARQKGFDLASLLKTNAQKARERFESSVKVMHSAAKGDPKAAETITTINKAAQSGDAGAIRAQKNLALAALVLAHTSTPAKKAQFDQDFALLRRSRSMFFSADARRQVATVLAAAKAGDAPAKHRAEHFNIAAQVLDMFSGRDYKITPTTIAKAGGQLPSVPASVKAAAKTLVAAKSGNPNAQAKIATTAKAALSGDMFAIKMMGDMALVGAAAAAKKGAAIHPNLKEASKIVADAKKGNPAAKRTIIRAQAAAKKGDPKGVKAMVALTAANTAQKSGGIPVVANPVRVDLLPLERLPGPLTKIADGLGRVFSFYREGLMSRR